MIALELVGKATCEGIAILQQLKVAETQQTVSPEQAEKLRRTIIGSIESLFDNGVYTHSMETQVAIAPSALPVDRKKLIAYHPERTPDSEADKNTEDDD